MLVIGLTGGIGSGKTEVAKIFEKLGVTIIDTDQIAHDITQPSGMAYPQIISHFGCKVLKQNKQIDRKYLREIVFQNPEERVWLEKLLHPLIRASLAELVSKSSSPYSIAVIPLLFETKKNPIINRVLVVDTTEENQIKRALERDKSLTNETIKLIIQNQINREKRIQNADDIIINNGSIDDLYPQVKKLHQLYLQLAAS